MYPWHYLCISFCTLSGLILMDTSQAMHWSLYDIKQKWQHAVISGTAQQCKCQTHILKHCLVSGYERLQPPASHQHNTQLFHSVLTYIALTNSNTEPTFQKLVRNRSARPPGDSRPKGNPHAHILPLAFFECHFSLFPPLLCFLPNL